MRRLSPQLFELAALQSDRQVLHRDRFNRDELEADAVQKFELGAQPPPVQLAGPPPGRSVLDGDLHPIKRSLSHLIDNALRHAPGRTPVPLSLRCQGLHAPVLIADDGPGLPLELAAWPNQQASLRDLPLRRADGGTGRPGLAIAQRVALLHGCMATCLRHGGSQLHGGSLRHCGSLLPLPAPQGGTMLCLALPLAARASPSGLAMPDPAGPGWPSS